MTLVSRFILLWLVGCVPAVVAAICADDWIHFDGSCYFPNTERKTWRDASQVCAEMSGALAVPDSQEEQDFLWAVTVQYLLPDDPWIGCNDIDVEGEWDCSSTYQNWYPPQPDNAKGREDCAHLVADHEGQWNDELCSIRKVSLCESRARLAMLRALCQTSTGESVAGTRCFFDIGSPSPSTAGHIIACGRACRADHQCRSYSLTQFVSGDVACQLNDHEN